MDVAIIGGGIAGLVLALTLHQQSIQCTVYELRQTTDIANPGAIGIAANALRPLDKLGLYDQVKSVGWPLTAMQFRNEADELITTLQTGGSGRYGYDTLRVVRRRLHDALLAAVSAAGIRIVSGKKFSHVVSTSSSGVTFAFADDTHVTSSLLIGADGIHSTVRKHIAPTVEPEYKGSLTLAAKLTSNPMLTLPQTPELQSRLHSISLTSGANGTFIAIPQSCDGQEVSVALDRPFPGQTRAKWDELLADKQLQYDMFIEGYDRWPETIQLMMQSVTVDHMFRSWPFYAIPDLEEWSSPDRRVILAGDAAHAIPPSAGQGACMAIEDAWSLGQVLGACQKNSGGLDGELFRAQISEWQTERRDRVSQVRTLTKKLGNSRLPKEMREQLPEDEYFIPGKEQMAVDWLYGYEYQCK